MFIIRRVLRCTAGIVNTGLKRQNARYMSEFKTTNNEEINMFSKLGKEWWDTDKGSCTLLHLSNIARIKYARQVIDAFCGKREEVEVVDVGCGGGLASECLARIGYKVTGVDPSEENIEVAKWHMGLDPLLSKRKCEYLTTTVEEIADSRKERYDAAVCFEVVEHVDNLPYFINKLCQLVKPGGVVIISTINRNVVSYLLTILLAEYVFKIVEKGTHSIDKYVKPSELTALLDDNGCSNIDISSLYYDVLSGSWSVSPPTFCEEPLANYIHASRKLVIPSSTDESKN